jgi:hypothetical protein
MAISRMQEPQQIRLGLGSLQDPRQGYLFGGVAKAVKKAVRGVKKIAKSPLGKAALVYAGTAGLGALAGGAGGTGFTRAMFSPRGIAGNFGRFAPSLFANPTANQINKLGVPQGFFPKMLGKMTTGQKIFGGLGATAIATPFIQKAMGVGPYEEIVEEEIDEDYIDPYTAVQMAKARDPYMNFLPDERFVQEGFYQPAANGGRIGYNNGGGIMKMASVDKPFYRPEYADDHAMEMFGKPYKDLNASELEEFKEEMRRLMNKFLSKGGRVGYANGEMVEGDMQLPPEAEKFLRQEYQKYVAQGGDLSYPEFKMMVIQQASGEQGPEQEEVMSTEAETIQTEPQMPMMMAEGGLMNLGGMEKDYRAEGGFVPIGKREKADDVPARLSVNEFVFTADAVRNAGGGDIDKGAEVMENLMDHLEAGGKVSEESQGAQAMYDNMKQLETRVV